MARRTRIVAAIVAAILVAALTHFSPAPATVGEGGSFVPVTPARLADTATGAGFGSAGSFSAGSTKSVKVTGVAGVPSTGVGAVVVDIAAASTADSRVYAWPSDESRGLATLSAPPGQDTVSTTALIRPGSDGRINVYNEAGTTRVNIDIQGYFTTTSTDASSGGFVPIDPRRVVKTEDSVGISGRVAGGTTYTVDVAGVSDVPTGAVGIYANVRALNASADGGLRVTGSDQDPAAAPYLVSYSTSGPSDFGAAIKLGPDGKIKLYTNAGSTIDVIIDIQGYFTAGTGGGSFHPTQNTRIWDSATPGNSGDLAPGEARTIDVTGRAGVPDDGDAGALALAITATGWTKPGWISVVKGDLPSDNGTSSLVLSGAYSGVAVQSTSLVELDGDGQVTIRNRGSSSVRIMLNVQGWFDAAIEGTEADDAVPSDSTPLACGSSSDCDPTLVDGSVSGTVSAVQVQASPADAEAPDAPADVEFEQVDLTSEAEVRFSGSHYTVRIDPESVPASVVQPGGLVSLDLEIDSSAGTTYALADVRVVRTSTTAEPVWGDPATTSPASSAAASTVTTPTKVGAARYAQTVTTTSSEDVDPPGLDGAEVDRTSPFAEATPMRGPVLRCRTMWLDYYKFGKGAVAATWPANGATAFMGMEGSKGTTVGVAVSANNKNWKQSSTKFRSGGWNKDWRPSKKGRAYTSEFQYRKRTKKCPKPGGGTKQTWWYVPRKETGEFLTRPAKRPIFGTRYCRDQSAGTFRRVKSGYKSFKSEAGLDFKGALGISLSVERTYNKTQFLEYYSSTRQTYCGNNDYVTYAGKIKIAK